ncbi:MAG: hypothetical protein LAO51_16010 [Acidobacteriia bacterium]|nr:hypothetical protein [Terriglobia bacterium]
MSTLTFTVSIPTDAGFVGRRCASLECRRYFKLHQKSIRATLHCPYCGASAAASELLTDDQLSHVRRQAEEQAREHFFNQVDTEFSDLARKSRGNEHASFTHEHISYHARPVIPTYSENSVDSELLCPECQCRFQVYGVFGYCPGCRTENQLIYDANLAILRREFSAKPGETRTLRHAYADLVSMFEFHCRRAAPQEHQLTINFGSSPKSVKAP